eukprot:TRINITY_DN19293_c0_g1_i1.p1 TRINITY_DN19293_c0_g1~~TRINITY_DN19293_c0_g1_i1.p1  ORF type:complete len:517 (-),score=88.84 TRINITY_DN19293_c0_g1_i1:82-1632(-)
MVEAVAVSSLQELLLEQVNAAQRVIAASHEIQAGLAAQGIHISLPKSPPLATAQQPDRDSHFRRWFGRRGGCGPAARFRDAVSSPQHAEVRDCSLEAGLTEPLMRPVDTAEGSPKIKGHSRRLFPDQSTLKARLFESDCSVEDLYKQTGMAQAVARNTTFQNISFTVIVLNTLWIGIATDYNKATVLTDAPIWVQLIENLFCLFFTFELGVRFLAFQRTYDAFSDGWFCFDSMLVVLMVYETWIEPIVFAVFRGGASSASMSSATVLRMLRLTRLTRLTRIARIARLLRQIPELFILSKALLMAMRSVGATLALLLIGIYIFSIFFTQMLSETEAGKGQFETVLMGMHTLLVDGILADQADIINGMLSAGIAYYCAILLYMLIVGITVADMLIGVISEVIEEVAAAEKEVILKDDLIDKVQQIVKSMDSNRDDIVSKAEFGQMLYNEAVTRHLHEIGVDVISLVDFADVIFAGDNEELSREHFVEIVLGFRETHPTVKHQMEMKRFVKQELASIRR